MFSFESIGNFEKTDSFFKKMTSGQLNRAVAKYGDMGVKVLAANTPVESGETANSWSYRVTNGRDNFSITWTNSHMSDDGGAPVAILLQYGHGTGTGGYVQGRDFINPAMRPIFNKIAEEIWKVVMSA